MENVIELLEAIEVDMTKCKVEKENVLQLHKTYDGIVSETMAAVAHTAVRTYCLFSLHFKVYIQIDYQLDLKLHLNKNI